MILRVKLDLAYVQPIAVQKDGESIPGRTRRDYSVTISSQLTVVWVSELFSLTPSESFFSSAGSDLVLESFFRSVSESMFDYTGCYPLLIYIGGSERLTIVRGYMARHDASRPEGVTEDQG